jgi:uncharacterized membrane protein
MVTFINTYDYMVFRNWVLAAATLGLLDIYAASSIFGHGFRVVYPPLAPLLFVTTVSLVLLFAPTYILYPYPPLPLRLAVKVPIVASLAATYRIIAQKVSEDAARLAVLNIVVALLAHAYVFEFPALALTLLAFYSSSPVTSGLLLAAATLLKQNLAIVLVPIALLHLRREGLYAVIKLLASFTLALLLGVTPFVIANGVEPIVTSLVKFHVARPPQGTNVWTLALVLSGYDAHLANRVSSAWLLAFTILAIIAFSRIGVPKSLIDAERLSAALIVALLLSSKVLNPHYMLWGLPFIAILAWRGVISMRAYKAYLAASLVELSYPVFTLFGAAVLARPFYIEEEARWLSPEEAIRIVKSAFPEIMPKILEVVRSTPLLVLFQLVYDNWHIVLPVLVAMYTGLMAYIFVELVRAPRLKA